MADRPRVPITPETKVGDLLRSWPELEELLVAQAPAFRRLRNPVLRRTVARVATLEQAAGVGGLAARELVATLRRAAGLEDAPQQHDETTVAPRATAAPDTPVPPWVEAGCVAALVDADALLDSGEVPLGRVNAVVRDLETGELLRVDSSFRPVPLVEALEKQGYDCFAREVTPGRFETFVRRPA